MKKYAIGLYEKAMPPGLSWYEKLSFAKGCDYDFLEISIDESDEKLARLDWDMDTRSELIETMRTVKLPIRSMCLSGHRKYPLGASDPAVRERGMEIAEKAIELADDLGIHVIQLAGYDVYYEESTAATKALFLDNLKKMVEMAASRGIVLGLETMETSFMDTVWKAMFYVNSISAPYLGVYPDCGNLTNAGLTYDMDALEDLDSGSGHIVALHLKESRPGVFREVPFFEGGVDFSSMIKRAWGLGVRRYVTEMWYTGGHNWASDIRLARKAMSRLLDEQI